MSKQDKIKMLKELGLIAAIDMAVIGGAYVGCSYVESSALQGEKGQKVQAAECPKGVASQGTGNPAVQRNGSSRYAH